MVATQKPILGVDEVFGRRKENCRFRKSIANHVYSHRQPNSPFLNWSSLQSLLETAIPHVLIILDYCFAATAVRDTTEGTIKEILAACGRESPTCGVGQRSFTSALIEEMQAFDGKPFTAAMLHSRLVTMRWRLAFTPIYALLSESGGSSITICPLSDGKTSVGPDLELVAELEATGHAQDGEMTTIMDDSPSLSTPQKQMVDTRVLLIVSVAQDAVHDVSNWVSWLTTAAPWDVTRVNVQVHSVFRSYSTLVVVSVPTSAWARLPERPAYRFVGFIRSGDRFKSAGTSTAPITETVSSRAKLPHTPCQLGQLPSSFSFQSQPPSLDTTPFDAGETKTPAQNTLQPFSSVHEAVAVVYPTISQSDHQSDPQPQRHHKRQGLDSIAQPIAKVPRRSPRISVSGAATSPQRAALDQAKTPKSIIDSDQSSSGWSAEDDKLLMRAHQQGLNWQPIASQYFPAKTANACRKRHERLMEKLNNHIEWNDVKVEMLDKAYVELRETIWRMVADKVGEKWQNVEAEVRIILFKCIT